MTLLSINDLTLRRDDGKGSAIINSLCLNVDEGDILVVKGESGSGKTTLLKCIAELNVYNKGEILLYGKTSADYGIPNYRTRVQYVPQRPSMLPGTPRQLLSTVQSFASRKRRESQDYGEDPVKLAGQWGIAEGLWMREWATLSGGEGQRIALAIAVGLGGAEVILLDEPTSALDSETAQKVEKSLTGLVKQGRPKAIIWVTHEAAQADRVATRVIDITQR